MLKVWNTWFFTDGFLLKLWKNSQGFDKEFPYPLNINALPLVECLRNGTPAEMLPVLQINIFNYSYLKINTPPNCHTKCQGIENINSFQ